MTRAIGWLAEQHADDQRRFMHLLLASCVGHALLALVLTFAPTPDATLLPEVLTVDLVASMPAAAPAPSKRRSAPPAAKPAPVPQAIPKPAPKPIPKEVVLPKEAPRAVPKKRVAPAPSKPVKYEDALSQLRDELGEDTPAPVAPEAEAAPAPAQEAAATGSSGGIARELAAWVIATQRHVRSRYITPPEFDRSLATGLEVVLTSGGELVGTPRVIRSSGDPFFDDNAIRAMMMSAPLPAPPKSGPVQFLFGAED